MRFKDKRKIERAESGTREISGNHSHTFNPKLTRKENKKIRRNK